MNAMQKVDILFAVIIAIATVLVAVSYFTMAMLANRRTERGRRMADGCAACAIPVQWSLAITGALGAIAYMLHNHGMYITASAIMALVCAHAASNAAMSAAAQHSR